MSDDRKIFLITGTSRGIGYELARYYSRDHMVYGCSRSQPDTDGDDQFNSGNYHHTCLDVADPDAVEGLFNTIKKSSKNLDVLINNAGTYADLLAPLFARMKGDAKARAVADIRKTLDTNLLGNFFFSSQFFPLLKKNEGGRIINLSSIAVPLKLVGTSIYAASKAACETLAQVMAREFAPKVTVNTVGPSIVDSEMTADWSEEKVRETLALLALNKKSTVADICHVIDFFINPRSAVITGESIYLGGVIT